MRDRPPPLPSAEIVKLARQVLARSSLSHVEHQTPLALDALLAAIDEAEAHHAAQVAAGRAYGPPERAPRNIPGTQSNHLHRGSRRC